MDSSDPGRSRMRTTLALDDVVIARARALTAICEKFALVRETLKALVEGESVRRLALLSGSEPALSDVPVPQRPAP